MRITALRLANFKSLRELELEPGETGLTIIGGKNAQGKTSVLDAIAYALGGEKYRPTTCKRDGALVDPIIHLETDDGLIVERKGKNSALTVTDSHGARHGQKLLDTVISRLAINLPKFLASSAAEKAKVILDNIGIGPRLEAIDTREKQLSDTRRAVGRQRDNARSVLESTPYHEDDPKPVDLGSLTREVAKSSAHNAEIDQAKSDERRIVDLIDDLEARLKHARGELQAILSKLESLGNPIDLSGLEQQIQDAEETNARAAENRVWLDKKEALDALEGEYSDLSAEIEAVRKGRVDLLAAVQWPYPGLSIADGEIVLDGRKWDCLSGAQQLIVSTAIATTVNPNCRFVLLDKLEQLDLDTLDEFGAWLVEHGIQAIATRVSTGDECTIIIENGELRRSRQ